MIYSTAAGVTLVQATPRTAGNLAVVSTAGVWTAVDTNTDIVIPAAAGDRLAIWGNFLTDANTNLNGLDVGTVVSGAVVNYVSSGTGTPLVEGLNAFYPHGNTFQVNQPAVYDVQAGDVSGGNVRLRLFYLASGAANIYASAAHPLAWTVANFRQ